MIARRYGIIPQGAGGLGAAGLDGQGYAGELPAVRLHVLYGGLILLLVTLAGQTVRIATSGADEVRLARLEPINRTFARPDIVDRRGALLATDVEARSLYADPHLIVDPDEASERVAALFTDLDAGELRRVFADRQRRFAWVKRGLTPIEAQGAHDLGLPGLRLRLETRRVYPSRGLTAGIVGRVDVDNRGIAGIERHLDELGLVEPVSGPTRSSHAPVRLSLDLGLQHAIADTLGTAMTRHQAKDAAGILLDVDTLEVLAAATPRPAVGAADGPDRIQGGVWELGSVAKLFTVALALDDLEVPASRIYDVREPMRIGRFTIADHAPAGRPLTLAEIFIRSSNVGAGLIAREAGPARQRAFLDRLGLIEPWRTEAGPIAAPLLPPRWSEIEAVTISYGHGLAVAPLQLAAAAASLVNGGVRRTPTYIAQDGPRAGEARVVSEHTSRELARLLRLVVTDPAGTGRRAEVEGFSVGGKTGTAEMPGEGGYQKRAVVASFLAVFPTDRPRYLLLVSLFEPRGEDAGGRITAGVNAAPAAAEIIRRIAPMLGLLPERLVRPLPREGE